MNSQDNGTVYTVVAVTDLQGFSSHLEVGAGDIRTSIGQQAIDRLKILQQAAQFAQNEKAKYPDFYPTNLNPIRINDALIFSLDLPEFLTPSVGESVKNGLSAEEVEKFFDVDKIESDEEFRRAYWEKANNETSQLRKLVGLVARVHLYVNRHESQHFFPGAKTIVTSGYRRPFISGANEDVLSANFAFSNAYLSGSHLHGPSLFLESSIIQMLCANKFAQNILRYAAFREYPVSYDPLKPHDEVLAHSSEVQRGKEFQIEVLRRKYSFRDSNPNPLAYLQIIDRLNPFLNSEKPSPAKSIFKRIIKSIGDGPRLPQNMDTIPQDSSLDLQRAGDISDDITIFPEIVETGKSSVLETEREKRDADFFNGLLKIDRNSET